MRSIGLLVPVSCLPSPHGIGTFGKDAYEFVDFLKKSGQNLWQILPIGPTGYGDSPYQSFSCFAGNPYFIDLDQLVNEQLLLAGEVEQADFGSECRNTDYGKLYQNHFPILKKAYERFKQNIPFEYYGFCNEETGWLDDFAMFMTLKSRYGGKPLSEWERPLRLRYSDAMSQLWYSEQDEISLYKFIQYTFFKQWRALKAYANTNGIQIVGDIPIYVAADSCDVWAARDLFLLDEELAPTVVAGCPPDYFSDEGQLWGNPIYNWQRMREQNFDWWVNRIRKALRVYDIVRIDHFRAFDTYYTIPYGNKNAVGGKWENGPGIDIFHKLRWELGDVNIIAEDLGDLFDSVRLLLEQSGFPGMKVMQFAFVDNADNYLPHNHIKNCVVYTGTHDNATLAEFIDSLKGDELVNIMEYLAVSKKQDIREALIRATVASVADIAVLPFSDYLGFGKEARTNTPSTLGGNWCFRYTKEDFTDDISKKMFELARIYKRIPSYDANKEDGGARRRAATAKE